MYKMKNGILFKNDVPVLALGLSYYPSYHPKKFPVRPEDDRFGQAKIDIPDMAEAGFNLVRFAANGDIKRVGEGSEGIESSFPLIDLCCEEAGKADMATMVRLQGYTLNVSGHTDEGMIKADGSEMGQYEAFLRASLNHDGIIKDNEDCTIALAKHFKQFDSVVSYQIYNEAHYAGNVDYNPHSINKYKKWLVDNGYKSEEEAMDTVPPKTPQENSNEWIRWRKFHMERLNWFLCHLDSMARIGNPDAENMTCHVPSPVGGNAARNGADFYMIAEGMEVVGITHYIGSYGESHYTASEALDAAESAAAVYGKHAWLVEYNARTDMPANEWDRETYSAIGSGFKGIMYYQWRADYPFPDGPEPNQFGILFNDRTKTEAYSHAIAMNKLINEKLSTKIASAEKFRAGVAVLFSNNANSYFDTIDAQFNARTSSFMKRCYKHFRKCGVPVDFVRSVDLIDNPLNVKLLILPTRSGLSVEEHDHIRDFIKSGGNVVQFEEASDGFFNYYDENPRRRHGYLFADNPADEVLKNAYIKPVYNISGTNLLDLKLLKGDNYYIACLINTDTQERIIPAGKVKINLNIDNTNKINKVTFMTPYNEYECKYLSYCSGELEIELPEIHLGGFILIE